MKLLPLTVSVKAAPPALAVEGLRLAVIGTGLLIVNVRLLEVPPPGLGVNTVTLAVPLAAMSDANIVAVNLVDETNVVVLSDPFQRTTESVTKPLPFTVNVKSIPPKTQDDGLRPLFVGTGGLLTVKDSALEAPPPWSGREYGHLGRSAHSDV